MDNAGHILPFWHFLGNLQEPPFSPPPVRPFKYVLKTTEYKIKKSDQNQQKKDTKFTEK
jgi:hypothetical protein